MRIAIQNPFSGQLVAETELSKRMYHAALNLGWEAAEVYTSAEINAFQPDFVIALHNNSPKLAGYPTYGCLWNPPDFFQGTEKYVKHVLSYDGYLTSSAVVERWLYHLLHHTPKRFFTVPFYTSCSQNSYHPPSLENPRLVYLGSNWDTPRFQGLFEQLELESLDDQPYLEVYGNPEGWTHLKTAYQGSLPYDGASVFKALNRAGVGLCLHREEHTQAELPSMRIFEIVASGAIAICGDHPFIRKAFGDSVLYLDLSLEVAAQAQQISEYMAWIKANPQAAIALSQTAHAIFLKHFTLEKLLLDIVPYHQQLIQSKGFTSSTPFKSSTSIEFIISARSQSPDDIQHTLESVIQQRCSNMGVIVVAPSNSKLDELLHPYHSKVAIKQIETSIHECNSTAIWRGFNAVEADYFAVIDDTTRLHPNHAFSLISLLEQHPDYGVAYSGVLTTHSRSELISETALQPEDLQLDFFHPFDLERLLMFEPLITLNGLIARRSLLHSLLHSDPQLEQFTSLCLLLYLSQQSRFLFSYEATVETEQRSPSSPSIFQQSRDWSTEASRLRFIFWHQEFAPGKSVQSVHNAYLERQRLHHQVEQLKQVQTELRRSQDQLQDAHNVIAAMKTSKFWQLRSKWFQLKRSLGLPTEDE